MILLYLALEFLFIGSFSIGGGMATIPFLTDLANRTGWFTMEELSRIIAISEVTPGPIGVNMATYVGYSVAGVIGGIVASLALVLPAFFIILLLAKLIQKWRGTPTFQAIFGGLRPASVGLLTAVFLTLSLTTFLPQGTIASPNWKGLLLFLPLAAGLLIPALKKVPIPVYLICAAAAGVFFQLGT